MSTLVKLGTHPPLARSDDYGPATGERPDTLRFRPMVIRGPLSARWWAVMRGAGVRGASRWELWIERHGDDMMRRLARHPARGI